MNDKRFQIISSNNISICDGFVVISNRKGVKYFTTVYVFLLLFILDHKQCINIHPTNLFFVFHFHILLKTTKKVNCILTKASTQNLN